MGAHDLWGVKMEEVEKTGELGGKSDTAVP